MILLEFLRELGLLHWFSPFLQQPPLFAHTMLAILESKPPECWVSVLIANVVKACYACSTVPTHSGLLTTNDSCIGLEEHPMVS